MIQSKLIIDPLYHVLLETWSNLITLPIILYSIYSNTNKCIESRYMYSFDYLLSNLAYLISYVYSCVSICIIGIMIISLGRENVKTYCVVLLTLKRPLTLSQEKVRERLVEVGVLEEWRSAIHSAFQRDLTVTTG